MKNTLNTSQSDKKRSSSVNKGDESQNNQTIVDEFKGFSQKFKMPVIKKSKSQKSLHTDNENLSEKQDERTLEQKREGSLIVLMGSVQEALTAQDATKDSVLTGVTEAVRIFAQESGSLELVGANHKHIARYLIKEIGKQENATGRENAQLSLWQSIVNACVNLFITLGIMSDYNKAFNDIYSVIENNVAEVNPDDKSQNHELKSQHSGSQFGHDQDKQEVVQYATFAERYTAEAAKNLEKSAVLSQL